ncbi:hypothetical protein V5N11_003790 [Cardamine amara subsp. amara]|uniref:Uncharacterized protein n=1 Tax=Cardamine amara subsp. amara TaxID=228776 RepID=A0ABD0ZRM1_CARAN
MTLLVDNTRIVCHVTTKVPRNSHSPSLLYLFIIWSFVVNGKVKGHDVIFYVQNKCAFPLWPAAVPNSGHPMLASGGFNLSCGGIKRIDAPWGWNGIFGLEQVVISLQTGIKLAKRVIVTNVWNVMD